MEKLDKSQSKNYSPLVLWADDLEELLAVLKDCAGGIKFVADDVGFDSVDEFVMESKGRDPSVVRITSSDPYLTVELYPRWASLYLSSSKLLPSGVFLKIDSILSRCQRKPRFFYRLGWAAASCWLIPYVFWLPQLKAFRYLSLVVACLTVLWLTSVAIVQLWHFSVVRPIYRASSPGFIRRNRDSIAIAIISALLGAAATKMADMAWPNHSNIAAETVAPPAGQPVNPPANH